MSHQLPYLHPERVALLLDAVKRRILIIDGAMGTMNPVIVARGLRRVSTPSTRMNIMASAAI